jgi:hypothetical protein
MKKINRGSEVLAPEKLLSATQMIWKLPFIKYNRLSE